MNHNQRVKIIMIMLAVLGLFASVAGAKPLANVNVSYSPTDFSRQTAGHKTVTTVYTADSVEWPKAHHNARLAIVMIAGRKYFRLHLLPGQRVLSATIGHLGVFNKRIYSSSIWTNWSGFEPFQTWMYFDDGRGHRTKSDLVRVDYINVAIYDPSRPAPPPASMLAKSGLVPVDG